MAWQNIPEKDTVASGSSLCDVTRLGITVDLQNINTTLSSSCSSNEKGNYHSKPPTSSLVPGRY